MRARPNETITNPERRETDPPSEHALPHFARMSPDELIDYWADRTMADPEGPIGGLP
ncbi:hypothetical protein [Spirillospora sp. CA-294931]|uniref:hypothetical protein n=1 Tax=Spirillospora sp. CA-294931 TaxID=3240042 RepID=UPI003D939617